MSNTIYIPADPAMRLLRYAAETELSLEEIVTQAIRHYLQKENDYAG